MNSNHPAIPLSQTITINNTTVSVKISGQGQKYIFFLHGASMSAETWLPQLMDNELQKNYKLIAIDIPGHGDSGWLDDSEYNFPVFSGIIKQVVETLVPDKFILVGLSYGTTIIAEITPPMKNCTGIMLVSPIIVNDEVSPDKVLTPGPFGYVAAANNPTDSELREFISAGTNNTETGKRVYHSYRNTDPAFRQSIAHTFSGGHTDQLANIQQWNVPVCVVFGSEEKSVRTNYLDNYPVLWNKKVNRIMNTMHVLNEEAPAEFNRLLLEFANKSFR
jgi:pimeloyl-ACP methyl ester carboxylesterase